MTATARVVTPPPPDPVGVLAALRLVSTGRCYDLDPGRFPGMPLWEGHPPFQVLSYRTPAGITNQGDQGWLSDDNNPPNVKIMSELIIAGCHSGTHIDALAHITRGPANEWAPGKSADHLLGDFGPLEDDASALPLIVTRGVLVDVAGHLGLDRLPKGYPISLDEFTGAMEAQGVHVGKGDVVCIRTGQMKAWPNRAEWAESAGSGITLPVAQMLLAAGALALGSDTEAVECMPSGNPEHPHPVHVACLVEARRHLIENMYLEQLAADGIHEFMFFASAPRITGATGSFVRPVAIV